MGDVQYNTHIQLKRQDGTKIYPVVDFASYFSYKDNEKIPGEYIANDSIFSDKINGTIGTNKGGTGASTVAEARTNLDVYSKEEITSLISGLTGLNCVVVETLPEASADTLNKIYLVKHAHAEKDSYDEYLTLKNEDVYSWEKIGNTDIDLTEYSKNTHTHGFTGEEQDITVTGTYAKATGISLSTGSGTANYTPAGTISLNRSADVTLETTVISEIADKGTLPSLESSAETGLPYLTDASLTNDLGVSYTAPEFTSATIKSLSEAGTPANLTSTEEAAGGIEYIPSLTTGDYTPEGTIDAIFSGETEKITLETTPSGTVALNPDGISENGVKYVESVSGGEIASTSSADFITSINGGSGELTSVDIQTAGDIPYCSSGVLKDTYDSDNKTLTLSWSPTIGYLHHTHTGAAAGSTGSAVTSVSGGGLSSVSKYLHPSFSGAPISKEIDITPKGSINASFNGILKAGLVSGGNTKYLHFTPNTIPTAEDKTVLATMSSGGNAQLTGNIVLNKNAEYLNFNSGALPTTQTKTVATGVVQQPVFEGTFAGSGVELKGELNTSDEAVTSTGKITPAGKITAAIE